MRPTGRTNRRTEDALRASEEQFSLLAEHAQDVIFRRAVEPEGPFEYVSPAIFPMTGYTPEELCSDPDILRKLVHPEDIPIVAAAARDVATSAPAPVVRFRWLRKDGEPIWVETRLAPLLDETGAPVSLLGIVRDVTDRKQAEDALQASEEQFRAIADQSTDIIVIIRPDMTFAYVSRAVETITGFLAGTLVDTSSIDLLHPDDLDGVWAVNAAGLSEPGYVARFEVRIRTRAGSWRVVEVVGQNLLHQHEIRGILATLRDVTDRKQAEDGLRASEEQFRLLAEHAQDVMFRRAVESEGPFEYVSPAIFPMTGYTPEELCSDPDILRKLVYPEDIPRISTSVQSGTFEAMDIRWICKDGRVIWTEGRGKIVLDEAGRPVAVEGIIRDVTDQKRAEDALRASEERFRLLAENAQDVIFRFLPEADTPFEYVSPAILPMTGYTPEEICSDPDMLRKLTHPDDLPRIFAVLQSGIFEPMDIRWICKDGRVIWTEGRGRIVLDEAGRPAVVEGIVRDVTELRAAEAERKRLLAAEHAARLEVEEASQLIDEQNQMLHEADQLKDELISVVSHDLRTPLTSIMGYLEIVMNEEVGKLEEEQRHFLEVVRRNADRLLVLVDDLLFISRAEAGRLDLALEEVDLAQIAADSVEAQQPKASHVGVFLGLVAGSISPITADRKRIEAVLENLLSNALKFTPAGGSVEVRVGTAGGDAVLEVSDTGVGIASADQGHLFERFFRSKKTKAVPGVGLGLAIVKAIVDAHHGRVSVQSKAGKGTTFRVELPLAQRAAAPSTSGHDSQTATT